MVKSALGCGSITMYADDAIYVVSNRKREQNTEKIKKTLEKLETYLTENELHLNVGKPMVLECMIPQKKGRIADSSPYLESGEKAILSSIRQQLGTQQHLGDKIPCACRKVLAEGFIVSTLVYLIPIWGTTTSNQTRRAQILLNKAVC